MMLISKSRCIISFTVAMLLASTCFAKKVRHESNKIDAEYYWYSQKRGILEAEEKEDGIVYVSIFQHHGPQDYWLEEKELEDIISKTRGYRGVVQFWIGFLRSTIDSEIEWGTKQLEENFDTSLSNKEKWLQWYDENGEFLMWDDEQEKFFVDEERKSKHLSEAENRLLLGLSTNKEVYKVGESIEVEIILENVYPPSGRFTSMMWVNTRLFWNVGVKIELRTHETNDVGYWHLLPPPPPPELKAGDFELLDGGQKIVKTYVVSKHLTDFPLKSGHYSIKAFYENHVLGKKFDLDPQSTVSENLPNQGPAWTGEIASLTEFFKVID